MPSSSVHENGHVICHVKTIRNDLFLLSLFDSVFHVSNEIQLEFKENESSLLTCTLNYQGNGTKKLEIELSEFVLRNKNLFPFMGLVATIIIIINGQSKVMTNQKTSSSPLKWKCKINNLIETAQCQQNKPDNCSAITSQSPLVHLMLIF
jgi:hypothetical protein